MWMVNDSQSFDPFCMLQLTWPMNPYTGNSKLSAATSTVDHKYTRCKRRNILFCVSGTRFYSVLQSDWCHRFTGQWHEKRVVCYQTLSNKNGGWVWVRDYIPTAEEDLCGQNILQSVVNWYCYVIAHNQFTYIEECSNEPLRHYCLCMFACWSVCL